MTERKATRQLGKQINRKLVLNAIKTGPRSRAGIAQVTGLSPATVSNLTFELIDEGFVRETGVVETSRGRPPVLLRINSAARYVVGVKVMPRSLVAVVTDLDANVVASRTLDGFGTSVEATHLSPESVIDGLVTVVQEIVADARIKESDLLGVGVGLAGIIDSVAGICRYSPFFGWRDADLVRPLQARLGLDVHLANDVDSLTIAEQWFGHGQGSDHFIVVTVGRGIGAGFVLNGQFCGGHAGGVGELAHVPVAPGGPVCVCGQRGCLEVMASDVALVRAAADAVDSGAPTMLAATDELTPQTIVEAATQGDGVARDLLAESGRWLGVGIATLVNLLNPQLVIVAGEGVEAGEWRLGPMRRAIEDLRFESIGAGMRLAVESAGDTTWARGAACVVLGEFFKSPLHQDRPTRAEAATG